MDLDGFRNCKAVAVKNEGFDEKLCFHAMLLGTGLHALRIGQRLL